MRSLKYQLRLQRLALARGFVLYRGEWVKEWPSGNQWRFTQDGKEPQILDKYGRLLRHESDGITVIGLLKNSK